MGILNDLADQPRSTSLTLRERAALEFNDEDNATRILSVFGDDLVFVSGKGWAVWDGTRYSFRSGNLAAREIGHRLRQLVLEEAEWARRHWEADPDDVLRFMDACAAKRPPTIFREPEDALRAMRGELASRLFGHATKCGNIAKVKSALEACEFQRRAEVEDMDNDPWSFTCPNGEIDLRRAMEWERPEGATDEEVLAAKAAWLKPVDRAKLPTKCGGVMFDPSATAPAWESFLELIVPDRSIRDCLQRALGATLFGENRAQVCLLLRGPGGNGKSTLLNGLSHVLGRKDGYAAPCKIEMFLETGNSSASSATPEESDLPGARAYIATEPGARDVLSAKKIKGLTGGDRRMSRGLYADPFFWTPTGIPIISCNRTPKIKDEDEGTRRRLIFFPFDVNLRALPVEKQRAQGDVEAEMRAQGSGILNWLIAGFQDFMAQGINPPEPMRNLKAQLLEAADPVGIFIDQMTVRETSARLSVSDFYRVHEVWCDQEGRQLFQMKTVGDIMVEKGFERGPVRGRSHWRGLRWAPEAADLVQEVTGQRQDSGPPIETDAPF